MNPSELRGGVKRLNSKVADRLEAEVGFPVEAVRGGYVVWHGGPHPCRTAREVRAVARRLRAAGAGTAEVGA